MKKHMQKKAMLIACSLFLFLFSCENPMVNYLLREDAPPVPPIPEPVASWNDTLYYSLKDAIDAADDGAPGSPSRIIVLKNVGDISTMGRTNGITINKYIKLLPKPGNAVFIHRWAGNTRTLFTVKAGASLELEGSVILSGAGMPGRAVYVETDGSTPGIFGMSGGACVTTDNDVYLEDGTVITVTGTLSAAAIARITPAVYNNSGKFDSEPLPWTKVVDGTAADMVANNERFDVTPENMPPASGWNSPRNWRVNDGGRLYTVAAKRVVTSLGEGKPIGTAIYYPTLQEAVTASVYGSYYSPEAVYLVSNIYLPITGSAVIDQISVSSGYVYITVESGRHYLIKREGAGPANFPMFDVSGALELGAPAGSSLTIDGGAVWDPPGSPADPGMLMTGGNTGVKSGAALVHVAATPGMLRLKSGAILRNNDRTAALLPNGGAVECIGGFEMTGGSIVNNRTAGGGGGVYFYGNNFETRKIAGGSITGNSSGLSGGGILFDNYRTLVAMSGGVISGNRARGQIAGTNPSCAGFGGGIFIPSHSSSFTPVNAFSMTGGEIGVNYSDSGSGNGVVVDTRWYLPPTFSMEGQAYINPASGNDIYFSRNSVTAPYYGYAAITITGNLTRHTSSNRALVTFDSPLYDASYPYPANAVQIISGLISGNYNKFNAAPHTIDSLGRLVP
jgi:hypothetical protein